MTRPVSRATVLHAVLEPYAVKIARTVLWGGGGGDAALLPAKVGSVRLQMFQKTRVQAAVRPFDAIRSAESARHASRSWLCRKS